MRPRHLLFLSILVLFACKKEEEEGAGDMTAVVDHVYTSANLIPILPLVIALDPGPGNWHLLQGLTCASVDSITGDTAAFPANGPVTVHLHFPDTGCTSIDGRTRAGDLRITLGDAIGTIGAQATISATDHATGGIHYRFTFTATCTADQRWLLSMDTVSVRTSGPWQFRLKGTYTYERIAGAGDPDPMNDAYDLDFNLDGRDRNGVDYDAYAVTDLRYALDCKWIRQGVEDVDPSNADIRRVDHGNGTCNAQTEVEIDGNTVGLTIP